MTLRTWFGVVAGVALLAACGGDDARNDVDDGGTEPASSTVAAPATSSTPGASASPVGGAQSPTPATKLGSPSGVATTAKSPTFTALSGAKASFGMIDRAAYQIEMPEDWNGELVLYAHGFAGFGTEVAVQTPPSALREHMIENGFAWAASSYSENGYDPGIGADDTLALKGEFEKQFGKAKRTYISGASMGGNVVALALEHHADAYDGGLAVCGALGGIEQIDYLVSWVALAEYTSGLNFPIGQPGANLAGLFLTDVPRELGSPANPTAKGKQFASAVKNLTGGPRPFFQEGFAEQYTVNFGLVLLDPERKTLINRAATNDGDVYRVDAGLGITSEQINTNIKRYPSDPAARNAEAHPDAVPTSGKITDPLLTLHNTGDLFVPISMEQYYRTKVGEAGKSDLLVQRAIRAAGHCKFSGPELTTAFDDLVSWVRDGKKPKGEDLSGDLTNAGREFTNPLRPGDPGGVE